MGGAQCGWLCQLGRKRAGCAGVNRDDTGRWEGGFKCNMRTNSVDMTERWAVLKGLE